MGWLDVPMTGGVAGAVAGTLVLMAGGETADVEKLRPVARCYSKRLTHMGPSGAGQVTKIANQMIIGAIVAIVAEALNLAANYGVSAQAIPDALSGGWADSVVLQNHGRRMVGRGISRFRRCHDHGEGHRYCLRPGPTDRLAHADQCPGPTTVSATHRERR